MSYITQILSQYQAILSQNPIVAGMFSLYGISVLTYLFRDIPSKIMRGIKAQFTMEIYISSFAHYDEEETFYKACRWLAEQNVFRLSRTYQISDTYGGDRNTSKIVLGVGSNVFIYNGRLFISTMIKEQNDSKNSSKVVYSLSFRMLGRSKQAFDTFLQEIRYIKDDNVIEIKKIDMDGCERTINTIKHRSIESVAMNKQLRTTIIDVIETFFNDEKWYHKHGIPYKKNIILHGLTGTGKSSLIKAIASYFNLPLYLIDLSEHTNSSLQKAVTAISGRALIAIEDFDSSTPVKDRALISKVDDDKENGLPRLLTLSGILNALDGIASANGNIIMLSTNVLNNIDSALLRKGRIDHIFEIEALTDKEVREYIGFTNPDYAVNPLIVFEDIKGCDLQALLIEHKDNFQSFFHSIPKKNIINNKIVINQ